MPLNRVPPSVDPAHEIDWESLRRELVPRAWRTLLRLGVPEDSVSDAVQDALLVVYRRRNEFRGESRWETWFFGILLRVAQGYRRKAKTERLRFAGMAPEDLDGLAATTHGPFEALERRAAAELLRSLVRELPSQLRDVFVLMELEELDLRAAASALGWSETTTKGRLRDARKRFNAAVERTRARQRHEEERGRWLTSTKNR